jgi:penicillin-binding protein 2
MLIHDQLKKSDPQLRWLSLVVLSGLLVLLAGLWWVQVVLNSDYKVKLEVQSSRTVRIPPLRGKILDRDGAVLADSRLSCNISLYLEGLRKAFDAAYNHELVRIQKDLKAQMAAQEVKLRRQLTAQEQKRFKLTTKDKELLRQNARFQVASNAVSCLGLLLCQPLALDESNFLRHYTKELVLPLPVLANLDEKQIARFLEQAHAFEVMDLERQPVRSYPQKTTAAHLLGQLRRDRDSAEGEEAFLNYPLPVLRGTVGIEAAFDQQLRGKAGAKSVLVNNLGYRQGENVWAPAEPGQNVVLTIDLPIQQAAEKALQRYGPQTLGAVVVMEAHTGDILALASSPTYDPNLFIRGMSRQDWERMSDATLRPQVNRATQENYAPGSILKTVVGLACLEAGLDPNAKIYNPENPADPGHGHVVIGHRSIRDTAPPGLYNFRRAIVLSSNTYFITNGMKAGIQSIGRLAQRLHLGERCDLPTKQEAGGYFPSLKRIQSNWFDGDTANLCIGQGYIAVTPLQMAVVTAALANGGRVLWPRLVDRIESQETLPGEQPFIPYPKGRIRDNLGVSAHSLGILREAMLGETEDPEGTGKNAVVPGLRICGKTGTAQVKDAQGRLIGYDFWFLSFAPFENPRYAVVVMIESTNRGSGGSVCAPLAHDIYLAIQKAERPPQKTGLVAQSN